MISKKVIPVLLLLLLGFCLADESSTRERYLHVSTNPSGADLYVGDAHPDFSDAPDYRIPAFIPVPLDKDQILITLFRPDFKDTSINVTLSPKDTSFLIVALSPAFDETLLQEQQADLRHRSRRSLGHRLMIASLVPLAASAIAAGVTAYEIGKADDAKKVIKNSSIDSDRYQDARDDFRSYQRKARTAKGFTYASFITGVSLLSIGFIFSF